MLRLIVDHLVPIGAPLTVAIDDTLFRRSGSRVYAAHWGYDGSLKVFKEAPHQPTHEEIRAVQLAWAQAAA